MGSVKDLEVLKEPGKNDARIGRFRFSDRYSVFDWGEMPDNIPGKGAAIAILGAYFFERLEEEGFTTHYLGLVSGGAAKRLNRLKKPADAMEVRLLRVVRPKLTGDRYDYSQYKKEKGGILIPLEVIYRNYLPEGSSVFRRLAGKGLTLEEMGLKEMPAPGQKLKKPFIDVSTKLEKTDRYMNWNEAKEISGLSEGEVGELKDATRRINEVITKEYKRCGLVNEDGKIEYGYGPDRVLTVVDVLGTLDECRFTYKGIPVSKEIARIYYRNTPWHKATEEAKKKDRQNWKEICTARPDPLPAPLKSALSNIYCACTNEITQKKWFPNVPALEESLEVVQKMVESKQK
jgi:phosphoribosylaminoimidazole-succinocarboxamide synthase